MNFVNLDRFVAALTGGLIGFFVAMIALNDEGVEWETLVTGFAAVAAATYTIRTMLLTDVRQQVRHDQLLGLTIRTDRRRVERAVARFYMLVDVGFAAPTHEEQVAAGKDLREDAGDYAVKLRSWSDWIEGEIDNPSVIEAIDVFTSEQVFGLERLRDGLSQLKVALIALQSGANHIPTTSVREDVAKASRSAEEVEEALDELITSMDRLAKEYSLN
jgi:hypothetical protein